MARFDFWLGSVSVFTAMTFEVIDIDFLPVKFDFIDWNRAELFSKKSIPFTSSRDPKEFNHFTVWVAPVISKQQCRWEIGMESDFLWFAASISVDEGIVFGWDSSEADAIQAINENYILEVYQD